MERTMINPQPGGGFRFSSSEEEGADQYG
jgi:hypothetical protein